MRSRSFSASLWACLCVGLLATALFAQAPLRLEFNEATIKGENSSWKVTPFYGLEARKGLAPLLSLKQAGAGPKAEGSASTVFNGEAGYYTLTVEYFDKSSGTQTMTLRVNDQVLSRWFGDNLFSAIVGRRVVPHVQLKPGDTIEIIGRRGGYDYAALIALEIQASLPPPPAKPVTLAPNNYSSNLIPLAERVRCVDPRLMIPVPALTFVDGHVPKSLKVAPVFLFRGAKGDRFEVEIGNPVRDPRVYEWSIQKWPAVDAATPTGTLTVPGNLVDRIRHLLPEDGIYELRVGGTVRAVTHPLTQPLGNDVRSAHFYVPANVSAFRIAGPTKGSSNVVLRDMRGVIVWEGDITPKAQQDIDVTADKAGQVWSLEITAGRGVQLIGVPPYGALTPAHLLAPEETLPRQPLAATVPALPLAPPRPLSAEANMKGSPQVQLIKDGVPACVIVTPTPNDASRALQAVMQRISGVLLPVVNQLPADGNAIVLGTRDDFPDAPVPANFQALNGEGVMLRTQPGRLFIISRSKSGLNAAVYTFLQRIGCRWYLGNDHWEFLPDTRDIAVAMDLTTQPDFLKRSITQGTKAAAGTEQMDEWCTHNRLGGSIKGTIHHSYHGFASKDLLKQNPEYSALKDTNGDGIGDQRTDIQPCTTHPDVIKRFLEGGVKAFEEDPDLDLLSVSPNDGTVNMCRCDRCRAVGTYSDCAWIIAHQVADAVRAKFPDRKIWIGFYAYGEVSRPPTIQVPADPDITIQIATAYNKVPLQQMFDEWPKYVGAIGVREYFAIPQWGANRPGKGLTLSKAARIMPTYKSRKATVLNAEGCPAWGGPGLAMYLAAQLMWDSTQSPQAVLNDFYTTSFGAAAEPMRRYFERWDREKFEPRTAKLALTDLREAMRKADTIQAQRHVSLFALYIHNMQMHDDWDVVREKGSEADRNKFIEEAGAFIWRTRGHGMLRQIGVSQSVYSGLPYFTQEEVVSLIEKDLLTLQAERTAELVTQFGGEMVPVPAEAIGQQEANDPWVNFPTATWVVAGEKGKPIVLDLAGKGGRIEVRFLPKTPGPEIETKTVTLETDETQLTLTPPATGFYRLIITAQKARYRLTGPNRASLSVPREKNKDWNRLIISSETPPIYFYVPEGAEAIIFGFQGKAAVGTVLEVIDSKGRVVFSSEAKAEKQLAVTPQLIDVLPENDNQVWNIRLSKPVSDGSIMLRGVPPYVQTNPMRLLIPETDAEEEP